MEASVNGGGNLPPSACEYAKDRHRNLAKWRNLWTILLFVFGTTVIAFLCTAVILFIRQDWLPGSISTLGTIVNGVAVSWVVSRRTDAVKEEEVAYEDVKEQCKGDRAGIENYEREVAGKYRLLGRW